MTRQYEVVYIFDSALEETAINERLTRFNTLIQQSGAEASPGEPLGQAHAGLSRQEARDRLLRGRQVRRGRPRRFRNSSARSSWMRECSGILVVVSEGAQPVPVTAGKSDEEDDE